MDLLTIYSDALSCGNRELANKVYRLIGLERNEAIREQMLKEANEIRASIYSFGEYNSRQHSTR